jgi:DNA-binding XRE family transcriptional regulator
LLFTLRGVDPAGLIGGKLIVPAGAGGEGKTIADDRVSDIFQIEMDSEAPLGAARKTVRKPKRQSVYPVSKDDDLESITAKPKSTPKARFRIAALPKTPRSTGSKTCIYPLPTSIVPNSPSLAQPPSDAQRAELAITGGRVADLRKQMGLSVPEMARKLGVSTAALYLWEKTPNALNLRSRTRRSLETLLSETIPI